jgi:hypothetical protein
MREGLMWRYLFLSLAFAAPAIAQVTREDNSIFDQLVPESFKLSGSAIAAFSGLEWRTTINYALTNDSGMNLFLGIERSNVSLGSCTDVESSSGGLPLLPSPGARIYTGPIGGGPPRGVMVLAGARIAGTIILVDCEAPNPGFETTPFAFSLMLGKQSNYFTMQVVPVSATVPVRRMRPPF